MDPITVAALARIYQKEILDSAARDHWGEPASSEIMELISEHMGSNLQQQAARELLAGIRPLAWTRRFFGYLVSAVKTVDTRRQGESAYGADPCAVEGE